MVRATIVVLATVGLAFALGAEAAAYAVPVLSVLALTVGGRYAGVDRLLALAERISARRSRRSAGAEPRPLPRSCERSAVLSGRRSRQVGVPRAPPASRIA